MKFSRYMHVEKLGTDDVDGILDGTVYVFPKIDGANVQVYKDGDSIMCGSRNAPTGSIDSNNWRGLQPYVAAHPEYARFFEKYPDFRLHGEWLIPHTLKEYVDTAWNKLYIFDVTADAPDGSLAYIPFPVYSRMLCEFNIQYIPCMTIVDRGIPEVFAEELSRNVFLMQPNCVGEGVVLKRYDYKNKFGSTVWAKIVRAEFKRLHEGCRSVSVSGDKTIEDMWVEKFVTDVIVDKEYAKLLSQNTTWDSKLIPALLGSVYHTLVIEYTWHALKKFKASQVIDFRRLQKVCVAKVKELKPELF